MRNKQETQFSDTAYYNGYTILPNVLLDDSTLSSNAHRIYSLLRRFAWQSNQCFPSHQTLSELTGFSKSTVIRALHELKKRKLINWKQRGMNKSNIYTLSPLKSAYPKLELSPVTIPELPPTTNQDVSPMTNKEYSVNNTQIKNTQLSLTKDKYSSYSLEAKELAKEFNDFKSIKYYQKVVSQKDKGDIEPDVFYSALIFVRDQINIRSKDNLSPLSNPAGLFVKKLKELIKEDKEEKQRDLIKNKLSEISNKMKI